MTVYKTTMNIDQPVFGIVMFFTWIIYGPTIKIRCTKDAPVLWWSGYRQIFEL